MNTHRPAYEAITNINYHLRMLAEYFTAQGGMMTIELTTNTTDVETGYHRFKLELHAAVPVTKPEPEQPEPEQPGEPS